MSFKNCLLLSFFLPFMAVAQKDFPAKELKVKWAVKDNHYKGERRSLAAFTLVNSSELTFPSGGWSLYFNYMKDIDLDFPGEVKVEQINGDLFRIRPKQGFKAIAKGDSVVLKVLTNDVTGNFTDAPGGLYLVWDQMPEKGFRIQDFTVQPLEATLAEVVSPEALYQSNSRVKPVDVNSLVKVLPTPVSYEIQHGNFLISRETAIAADPAFKKEAGLLAEDLAKVFQKKPVISFESKDTGVRLLKADLPEEAYRILVAKNAITISASGTKGMFYGLQSLKSLMANNSSVQRPKTIAVPCVKIEDWPRFKYRGFMLDVARNFHSKEEVLRVLDLMALYKLNVFHFHLNDDEGWRLQIPELPELTAVGAKRGHSLNSEDRLPATYHSGPETAGQQFYTPQDFIEILKYAADRHIQVVPEIETPGHARAAIKSMDARYRRFMNEGKKQEATQYLLRDLQDSSVYSSAQAWNDNVICVALPSAYRFLETVTEAIEDMYQQAGVPLTMLHFGGDELPKGAWEHSPACLDLVKKEGLKHTDELWDYYVGRLEKMLKPKGIALSGWEEMGMRKTRLDGEKLMVPNPLFVNDGIQLDIWNNIIGGGSEDLPYRLANAGYKVVLTCASNFYLDQAYNRLIQEPGHNWASYVDLEKLFSFIPYDYYKNTVEDSRGEPVSKSIFTGKDRLTDFGQSNIIGLKAALWTEKVRDRERLEYMLLPRLLGLAERAWAKDPEWALETDSAKAKAAYEHDLSDFYNRIGWLEFPRLDQYHGGFNYRIPPVGAKLLNGAILCNTEFPGFNIYYTTNGKTPSVKDKRYSGQIKERATLKLRAFNHKGRGGATTTIHQK